MRYKNFQDVGKKLLMRGLNNSHSGNISQRENSKIFVTRTGSMLDDIMENDIVEVSIFPDEAKDKKASMELLVHRAIYQTNDEVKAVVHAHPPYSIVMADKGNEIIPYEQEGRYFFDSIPILRVDNAIASHEVAQNIGPFINQSQAVIVAQHGVFSWGKTLEEAYHYLTVVESACRVNYLLEVKNAT